MYLNRAKVTTIVLSLDVTNLLISDAIKVLNLHQDGKLVAGSSAMNTVATILQEQVDVTVYLKHPVSFNTKLPIN